MSEREPLPAREPALRVMAGPGDTNAGGDVFGGWLMSQVDVAGSIAAIQRARGRVVTVAVNHFQFLKPVYVGDLVSCYAEVAQVGNTSLAVDVVVYVQRGYEDIRGIRVAEARLTYVALDEARRPRPVPREIT